MVGRSADRKRQGVPLRSVCDIRSPVGTRAKDNTPHTPKPDAASDRGGGRMATSEGYGQRLADRLRAEQAHAITTRILRTADMAVTETRCDDPCPG